MIFAQAPTPALRFLSTLRLSDPFARSDPFLSVLGEERSTVGGGGTGEGASSRHPAPSAGEGDRESVGEGVDWAAAPNGAAHNLSAANGATRTL